MNSFRPLIGVIISKRIVLNEYRPQFLIVSVPLSGLLFLNHIKHSVLIELYFCFRPLIGVIISKPGSISQPNAGT